MCSMSQKEKLFELLRDGEPHRTDEIVEKVYGDKRLSLSRVGARIHDLKIDGHNITGWKDENRPTLYWYQLIKERLCYKSLTEKFASGQEMSSNEIARLFQ